MIHNYLIILLKQLIWNLSEIKTASNFDA